MERTRVWPGMCTCKCVGGSTSTRIGASQNQTEGTDSRIGEAAGQKTATCCYLGGRDSGALMRDAGPAGRDASFLPAARYKSFAFFTLILTLKRRRRATSATQKARTAAPCSSAASIHAPTVGARRNRVDRRTFSGSGRKSGQNGAGEKPLNYASFRPN